MRTPSLHRSLILPALLLCACTTQSESARTTSASDSAEVTELSTPTGSGVVTGRAAVGRSAASDATQSGGMMQYDAAPASSPKSASGARQDSSPAELKSNFRCGVKGSPVLTSLGIGNLQVGGTIAVVKQTCSVRRDLQEVNEGAPERVVTVIIDGEPIRVTVVNGLVWRIALASSHFTTRSGLRVGTSLSQLINKGGAHLSEGEDGLYVMLDSHCGLSFRFSISSRETPGRPWTVAHVVQRHGSARVDRILVTRCAG